MLYRFFFMVSLGYTYRFHWNRVLQPVYLAFCLCAVCTVATIPNWALIGWPSRVVGAQALFSTLDDIIELDSLMDKCMSLSRFFLIIFADPIIIASLSKWTKRTYCLYVSRLRRSLRSPFDCTLQQISKPSLSEFIDAQRQNIFKY